MSKREFSGRHQERFDHLWAALLGVGAKDAGELTDTMVSQIIGCTPRHARRLIRQKTGRIRKKIRVRMM